MDGFVHVCYTRRIDHPLDEAYAWLTDFDDRDGERAGAVLGKRRILERDETRVVAENVNVGLSKQTSGIGEVLLHPPDRWEAEVKNKRGRVVMRNQYRLEPRGEAACELIIDYHFAAPKLKHRLRLLLGRPLVRKELRGMWNGYIAAMDEELSGPDRSRT